MLLDQGAFVLFSASEMLQNFGGGFSIFEDVAGWEVVNEVHDESTRAVHVESAWRREIQRA